MTNLDRIKRMDEWELARFIYTNAGEGCRMCSCNKSCKNKEWEGNTCIVGMAEWLMYANPGKAIMGGEK